VVRLSIAAAHSSSSFVGGVTVHHPPSSWGFLHSPPGPSSGVAAVALDSAWYMASTLGFRITLIGEP